MFAINIQTPSGFAVDAATDTGSTSAAAQP